MNDDDDDDDDDEDDDYDDGSVCWRRFAAQWSGKLSSCTGGEYFKKNDG